MKKVLVTSKDPMGITINAHTTLIEATGGEDVQVSDGYHTFDELYEHRITLFIKLCWFRQELIKQDIQCWRSKLHHDGTSFDGWFIMGIGEMKGEQITYHLPMSKWEETNFAATLERAPEWDGHTSADVLKRLKKL